MRLFFISLALALIFLYPEVSELLDWEKRSYLGFLRIPYVGLYYMIVFFHELGHTLTYWLFGQPAVPAFNFADGGGVAVPLMDRSMILQGLVYAGFAGLAFWLFRHEAWGLLVVLALFTALHGFMAWGDERYRLAMGFMGEGGGVVMGCYCIFRAAANWTYSTHSPAMERYINMVFGMFAVLQAAIMALGLIFSDAARDVYEAGIGGHLTNDFVKIADTLNTKLQNVAWFSLGFTAFCVLVTALLYFDHWRHHGFEERAKLH